MEHLRQKPLVSDPQCKLKERVRHATRHSAAAQFMTLSIWPLLNMLAIIFHYSLGEHGSNVRALS